MLSHLRIRADEEHRTNGVLEEKEHRLGAQVFQPLSLPFPSCGPWRGHCLFLSLSALISWLSVMRVKEACGQPRAWATENVTCSFLPMMPRARCW